MDDVTQYILMQKVTKFGDIYSHTRTHTHAQFKDGEERGKSIVLSAVGWTLFRVDENIARTR